LYDKYYEWDERIVQIPKSSLAYKHKLLAAGRYLEGYGYNVVTADSVDFLKELPSTDNVIVFNYFPGSLTDDYYTRIDQWVKDGGHLITGFGPGYKNSLSWYEEDEENDDEYDKAWEFFENLGIEFWFNDYADDSHREHDEYPVNIKAGGEEIIVESSFQLLFHLPERYERDFTAQEVLDTGPGLGFAQFQYGSGKITLSTDALIWENDHVGEADNALLLAHVLAGSNPATIYINDTVLFVMGFFELTWYRFKWLVLALAVLGLALLRQAWVRFGSIETVPDQRSNNFARHLKAVTQYHVRYGLAGKMLAPVQATARSRFGSSKDVNSSGVDPARLNQEQTELVMRVAKATGLPEAQISQALYTDKSTSKSLVSIARGLQATQQVSGQQSKSNTDE